MTNEALGISIGLSLRGIGSLGTLSSSLNSLKNTLTDVKNGFKDVEVRTKTLSSLKIDQGNLKDQLSTINNLIRGGIAYGGVKVAMDFESAMADVKKVVDFTSEVDFQNFSNELLNLSRTIPLSAQELATITASGGQLGIAKDELMDYTKIVAKMGVTFDMSASMVGESIATLKNVLNLSMSEVENLGDTINHLSDNSAAKASAIVETISRVGGVAKVFKLSADQTAALSSSFIALGKSPEVASTAINALLNKMMTAPQQGAKFQEALNQIGIDSQYMKVAIQHNPQKALEQFLSMLEGVKDSEKMGVLTNRFGTEYADDMALLTSSVEDYKKAIKIVNDDSKKRSMSN